MRPILRSLSARVRLNSSCNSLRRLRSSSSAPSGTVVGFRSTVSASESAVSSAVFSVCSAMVLLY